MNEIESTYYTRKKVEWYISFPSKV